MDLLGTVRGHVVAGTEERLTDAIMICTDPAHLGDPQFVALMNVASCKLASLASSPGASAAPTSPPAREPATPPTRQAAGSAPPQFMDLTEDAAAEPAAPPPPKVGLSQAQQLDRALDGSALDGAGVDPGRWMYLHKVKLDDATLRRLNNGQPISAEGLLGKHSSGPCAVKATGAALGVDPQKRTALCSNIITEWAKAGLNWYFFICEPGADALGADALVPTWLYYACKPENELSVLWAARVSLQYVVNPGGVLQTMYRRNKKKGELCATLFEGEMETILELEGNTGVLAHPFEVTKLRVYPGQRKEGSRAAGQLAGKLRVLRLHSYLPPHYQNGKQAPMLLTIDHRLPSYNGGPPMPDGKLQTFMYGLNTAGKPPDGCDRIKAIILFGAADIRAANADA